MTSTIFLTVPMVIDLHERQIEQFGGSEGIRDIGLIAGAVMRPQTGYYADVIEEAAALWESLAMNHGFVDGNKRIAFVAVDLFLILNNRKIVCDADAVIAFIYGALENGTFHKDHLENWLRLHVIEI